MLTACLLVLSGLILLVYSGDRFVAGSSATARNLGVSPLLIGLTIVGFGTSAPEIFVSIISSLSGNPGIAVGNAIGSNIANVGLVIGFTALLRPLTVHSSTLKREFPVLFIIMFAVAVILWDDQLQRLEGSLLLAGMVLVVAWMIWQGLRQRNDEPMVAEFDAEIPKDMSMPKALGWVVFGLICLPLSSELLVNGATTIARHFGVSDVVIGLTIVAIGTSLPELAASLAGAFKGEDDIAIGNVLGSNMFNLLAVLGIPGLIDPGPIDPEVLRRDYPVMVGLAFLLFIMSYRRRGSGHVKRLGGGILLAIYLSYLALLLITSL